MEECQPEQTVRPSSRLSNPNKYTSDIKQTELQVIVFISGFGFSLISQCPPCLKFEMFPCQYHAMFSYAVRNHFLSTSRNIFVCNNGCWLQIFFRFVRHMHLRENIKQSFAIAFYEIYIHVARNWWDAGG